MKLNNETSSLANVLNLHLHTRIYIYFIRLWFHIIQNKKWKLWINIHCFRKQKQKAKTHKFRLKQSNFTL